MNQYQEALAEVEAARRYRPVYPEASAVEGRIIARRLLDNAGKSFRRAIKEVAAFNGSACRLGANTEDKGQIRRRCCRVSKGNRSVSDTEPIILPTARRGVRTDAKIQRSSRRV